MQEKWGIIWKINETSKRIGEISAHFLLLVFSAYSSRSHFSPLLVLLHITSATPKIAIPVIVIANPVIIVSFLKFYYHVSQHHRYECSFLILFFCFSPNLLSQNTWFSWVVTLCLSIFYTLFLVAQCQKAIWNHYADRIRWCVLNCTHPLTETYNPFCC